MSDKHEVARQISIAQLNPPDNAAHETIEALKALHKAPFQLFLGGSRRRQQIGKSVTYAVDITPNTDYDWYATHDASVEQYLAANLFDETPFSSLCRNTSAVGLYAMDEEAVALYRRGNVEVALRKDALFYSRVFESIPDEFYYRVCWKSAPHKPPREAITPAFNALYAIARQFSSHPQQTLPQPTPQKIADPLRAYDAAMKGII